jgi:ABC-2 type transport system ATP-binding protein
VSDPAIETRHLRRQFGDTLAVADLSLTVGRGEIFGFLGPNGAGKSTTIKMLLGLIAPTSGSGTMLGAPLGDRPARRGVGFLPEHFRFHDVLTARELLRFHGRLHGLRGLPLDVRIDDLLARVDLLDAADRPLRGYSKGMMQRAGLAQALINDPALVFLDEPTSGLDPLGRLLVRDIMADLRSRGTTVFLNSHLLGEVEATCDRVAFVKQGRILQDVSLSSHTAALDVELRVRPRQPCLVDALRQVGTDVTVHGADTVRMRVACEAALADLSRLVIGHGADLLELRGRRKSLEERFVEVMGGDQRPG